MVVDAKKVAPETDVTKIVQSKPQVESAQIVLRYSDGSVRTRELVATTLRYGENWDQAGAVLERALKVQSELRGRKPISFNNEGDMDSAFRLVEELDRNLAALRGFGENRKEIVAIIKHKIPSGLALGTDQTDAYARAFEGDKEAAFGGIFASNTMLTKDTIRAILDREHFLEGIVTPGIEPGALEMIPHGKTVRVVDYTPEWTVDRGGLYSEPELRSLSNGRVLIQDFDSQTWAGERPWNIVTTRQPTNPEIINWTIAWVAAKYTVSNAVAFVKESMLRGITGGQQKRSDAAWFSGERARKMKLDIDGASAATDGFWPFPDGIEEVAKFGITAVLVPGGEKNKGKREQNVIDAANAHSIAMGFTDKRAFKH